MNIMTAFWALIFSKSFIWVLFDGNYGVGTNAWILGILFLSGLYFYINKFQFILLEKNSNLLILYLIVAIIVVDLASNIMPWAIGGVGGFFYSAILIIPVLLGLHIKYDYVIVSYMKGSIIAAAASLFYILATLGVGGVSSRTNGLAEMGPNTIGMLCGLAFFSGLALIKKLRHYELYIYAGLTLFVFAGIFLAFSKSSIFGLIAALIMSSALSYKNLNIGYLLFILVGIFIFGIVFYDSLEKELYIYSYSENSFENLSGRTLLWDYLLGSIDGYKYIFGTGYDSSRIISREAGMYAFGVDGFSHAHNAFLEAIVNTGIVGCFLISTLLFAVIILSLYSVLSREKYTNYNIEKLLIFRCIIFLTIRSFSEGSISQAGTVDAIVFMYLSGALLVFSDFDSRKNYVA